MSPEEAFGVLEVIGAQAILIRKLEQVIEQQAARIAELEKQEEPDA